jgi:hypothetical protein
MDINKEKFELHKKWAKASYCVFIKAGLSIDFVSACVLGGMVIADIPDNHVIFSCTVGEQIEWVKDKAQEMATEAHKIGLLE